MAFEAATGAFFAESGESVRRVADVGFRPDVVLLWWSGQSAAGRQRGCRGGVGFSAGGRSVATGWYAEDGTRRTVAGAATADVAVAVPVAGREPAHAKLGLAAEGFVLRWDSPPDSRLLVQHLSLRGVSNAVAGRLEAEPSRGRDRVRTGFRTDLVLLAAGNGGTELLAGLGVSARGASAASSFVSPSGLLPGSTAGLQRVDAALAVPRADRRGAAAILRVRPDDDGFDVEWEGASAGVLYLALGGVRCRVGMDDAPSAPAVRRTRSGFRPGALLAFTWGIGPWERMDIGRLCIGAAAGSSSVASAWFIGAVPGPTTQTGVVASQEHFLLIPDTQHDSLHASACVEAFHADGFSLRWLDSDGRMRRFAYLAIADRGVRVRRLLPSTIALARRLRGLLRRGPGTESA